MLLVSSTVGWPAKSDQCGAHVAKPAELLLIGGRSGVGKSAVAFEVSAQLAALQVSHAVIEGDFLDLAFPSPSDHRLAAKNLATIWGNYRDAGYRRLIYTNTASVLSVDWIVSAMGGEVRVTSVLLSCSDRIAGERLAKREIASALSEHVDRSNQASIHLEASAPGSVARVDTDGQSVVAIAEEVVGLTSWTVQQSPNL